MIDFKTRKLVSVVFGATNIALAFYFHGSEFGLLVIVTVLLSLLLICFREFSSRFGRGFFYNNPIATEIAGWICLCASLFYIIFPLFKK